MSSITTSELVEFTKTRIKRGSIDAILRNAGWVGRYHKDQEAKSCGERRFETLSTEYSILDLVLSSKVDF